jgi:membrane protease YdiL (CAAX protease family)
MTTIMAFIKRHAVLLYFVLTFAISFSGILIVAGPGAFLGTAEEGDVLDPSLYLAMLLGPSISGILLTGLVAGKAGLRELLSRLLRWRVGARWYAVALLTYPLTMTAILGALALISPQVLPATFVPADSVTLLLSGIVAGLAAGFFEELGWTGFAIPKLRLQYGVVLTGLIVGLLWGAWHYPLFTASASSATAVAPVLMLAVLLFSFLPPFRVLMVWVYERTQSLLVAILMHASFAGSTVALALVAPGLPALTYDLALAAVLWVVIAAIAVANHGHIARPPLGQQGV